jgi:hypothetical protein
MPQKTNLNVSPYYDDFDKANNFYKVLFKPGQPVQARELTTLQSMLQNQVESFGSHVFKEGSMVVPGNINVDTDYHSVKIETDHLGIPVALYAEQLKGTRLKGQTSGIIVSINGYALPASGTDITDLTLYVSYLDAGPDNTIRTLDDGEVLITQNAFVYGNTPVNIGDTVATLSANNACAIGSAVSIGEGVFFIRGTFVDVASDVLVLDSYENLPSYRVGLNIQEELISAKDDPSLFDNARGFTNYAAPGADRLKISTTLIKKSLNDYDDKTFIELVKIDNGVIKKLQNQTIYSQIGKEFARRTFKESGNYTVEPFTIQPTESLNDGISNEGAFSSDRKTDQGNTPSDDLMCYKVSPGKAFVQGWEVNRNGTSILDVAKPRDKETVDRANVPFNVGNLLRVNNVYATPFVGVNNDDNIIDLINYRKDTASPTAKPTGSTVIGQARVYSFGVTDAAYTNASTSWDLYLFDIQTYQTLTINVALSNTELPATSYIRGVSSGATGFAVGAGGGGTAINVTQTSGTFIEGEQIIINDDESVTRSTVSVKVWEVSDIKSVYQNTSTFSGYSADFSADSVLYPSVAKGFSANDAISVTAAGAVTAQGKNFLGIRSDAIISYPVVDAAHNGLESFARVRSVEADGLSMNLSGVSTITGVTDGGLPTSTVSPTFKVMTPTILNGENSGLYAPLGFNDVSDVNLTNSTLLVTKALTGETTDGSGVMSFNVAASGISSAFYSSFDAERYSIHYADGSIEDLTSDQFALTNAGGTVTINGCTASQSNVVVNTTIRKDGIQNKQKVYVRSERMSVNKTIVGVSTISNGLTENKFYGLRVQDKEVSLNVPDVANIVGIYESLDSNVPILDKLIFVSGLGLNNNSILGERVIGSTSGAVAQITSRDSATQIEIGYLNDKTFIIGETITFQESNIISTLIDTTLGSYLNITDKYTLDKGQREQFYDYSRIVRRSTFGAPTGQLLVVYNQYQVPAADAGDVYTVESYDDERFSQDVPHLKDGLRASDTIDFRPRVQNWGTTATSSPFAWSSREFGTAGVNPTLVVAPREASVLGISYYLPRIDKLVLTPGLNEDGVAHDKRGKFEIIQGVGSLEPGVPSTIDNSMHVANIILPAYLYDPDDARVIMVDNRRYTMRDIGKIEDRVENLEITTSLSLLELDTKTLQVQDADGLSRFKTGFFVDDFKSNAFVDVANDDCKVDIKTDDKELRVPLDFFTVKPELALSPDINTDTADFSSNLNLLDSNLQKSGDLITLKYDEEGWIEQPLASRVENVNPFNMVEYIGFIELNPSADTWVRNVYVDGGERTVTGDRGGFVGEYIDTVQIGSEADTHIRSRNVAFSANALRPVAKFYPFFDGSSGIDIVPKLLEVVMDTGIFSNGETIEAWNGIWRVASFRTCQPNHKTGPNLAPATTFNANPYNTSVDLPTSYAASSTVVNVDIASLVEEAQGQYYGYVEKGTVLVGASSGAQATVSDVKLVADTFGDLYGAFWFRNPLATPPPSLRFRTGTRSFKLTSSESNAEPLPGSLLISSGETTYRTSGIVDIYSQTLVRVVAPPPPPRRCDPLAQSFTTDSSSGCFLTSVDIFMANKDASQKLRVELRTVELGTPTAILVQEFAAVTLDPSQINTSTDGTVATNVKFPSPIWLEPDTEYALVLLAPTSDLYESWIAKMGERTVNTTTLPDAESVMVTRQYLGGSLFKSQNGTIWSPSQFEDMKFKLYKAQFTSNSGSVYFYNPSLGKRNNIIPRLLPNTIRTLPRKLKVGITAVSNASMTAQLNVGRKVSEDNGTGIHGYIEKTGGPVNTIALSNGGKGYGKLSATTNAVPTYAITGNGSGATVNVTVNGSGVVTGVVLTATDGSGYVTGDTLGIQTSSMDKGAGCVVTVSATNKIDTLYLTNVQGQEFTSGKDLVWFNDAGTGVAAANTDITSSSVISDLYNGNVIEVTQYNHGHEADNNLVTLADIEPNGPPILTTTAFSISETGNIGLADTTSFSSWNGATATSGYVRVNSEVMFYNSIGNGVLGIATRGCEGTLPRQHAVGAVSKKYELNGISLTGINTDHNLHNNLTLKNASDIDKYYLEIDRATQNGDVANAMTQGDGLLSFTNEKSVGGNNIFASQNLQFNGIIPSFNIITPGEGTAVTAQLRTVSGTSAGGSEISFRDQGYENVEINEYNRLTSTRLLCSQINENTRLSSLPKNRSVTSAIRFTSDNTNTSPVLDTKQGISFILERSRLNKPVDDYATDARSNQITGDPHAACYISKRIDLKQPATSLKVLVGAHRKDDSDFRVLYQLFRTDSGEIEQAYELFPGYDNLRDTDGDGFGDDIIDVTRNSGLPDAFVGASKDGEFNEYQFSVDDIDEFTGFRIKIVFSGSDEANPPKLQDLRVLALA